MYKINFYKDTSGREPVREYLDKLAEKGDKQSRVKLNKIRDYMKILSIHGTYAGEPYVKNVIGDIWELRPKNERILFFGWTGAQFIMLHSFVKKSNKTPQREINQAKRNMHDFIKRSSDDEQK